MDNKIEKIGQLAITVSDVEKALEFYRDILGLEFLFSPSENLAFVQCGQTRIMLSTPQGAALEREPQLAAKMPDHELWIGFLKDPDGNLIGIMKERHTA